MILHPCWKACAAAGLLLLAIVPSILPGAYVRSASRYFLHQNDDVYFGIQKLRSPLNATNRRALPAEGINGEKVRGANEEQIRFTLPLLDADHNRGQHRLLSGSKQRKDKLPGFCDMLNFRVGLIPPREVYSDLDPHGALCTANVFDIAQQFPELSTFVNMVKLAGLEAIFLCAGPFTLLAPSNSAFAAIDPEIVRDLLDPTNLAKLQDLVLHHILARRYAVQAELEEGYYTTLLIGQDVLATLDPIMFNRKAGVARDDIVACNGDIYILDGVLVLTPSCVPNVMEVAQSYPELTLVTALFQRAELDLVPLASSGPFTLLLPSNAAFDEMDPIYLEFLLRPENQQALEDLLLYHVLPGSFLTTELVAGELDTLLPGEVVTVEILPVMFNDAAVLTTDISACNGIIHIIDAVLLPL